MQNKRLLMGFIEIRDYGIYSNHDDLCIKEGKEIEV